MSTNIISAIYRFRRAVASLSPHELGTDTFNALEHWKMGARFRSHEMVPAADSGIHARIAFASSDTSQATDDLRAAAHEAGLVYEFVERS